MKTLLLASVALGLAATPAMAKPGHGHGHGNSHHQAMTTNHHMGSSRYSTRLDANRNGILDRNERGYRDRDRDGRDDRYEGSNRHGSRWCPPGLAKKHNRCTPPGLVNRQFRQGQRIPTGYGSYTPYSNIPSQYRDQYNLDPNNRYIYRDNQIYVVDPRTSLVQRVISSLVR